MSLDFLTSLSGQLEQQNGYNEKKPDNIYIIWWALKPIPWKVEIVCTTHIKYWRKVQSVSVASLKSDWARVSIGALRGWVLLSNSNKLLDLDRYSMPKVWNMSRKFYPLTFTCSMARLYNFFSQMFPLNFVLSLRMFQFSEKFTGCFFFTGTPLKS